MLTQWSSTCLIFSSDVTYYYVRRGVRYFLAWLYLLLWLGLPYSKSCWCPQEPHVPISNPRTERYAASFCHSTSCPWNEISSRFLSDTNNISSFKRRWVFRHMVDERKVSVDIRQTHTGKPDDKRWTSYQLAHDVLTQVLRWLWKWIIQLSINRLWVYEDWKSLEQSLIPKWGVEIKVVCVSKGNSNIALWSSLPTKLGICSLLSNWWF